LPYFQTVTELNQIHVLYSDIPCNRNLNRDNAIMDNCVNHYPAKLIEWQWINQK